MTRLINISILGLTAMLTIQAGQIQIGGTSGLTNSYVNLSTTSSCTGASNPLSAAHGFTNCAVVTQTSVSEKNYVATLFQNATGVANPTSSTFDGSVGGVTFSRISGDTIPNGSADYWATGNTATSSIVIPVGIYGVDKVWTMLNDYWGGANEVGNIAVSFLFASSSNGTGTPVKFDLKNGATVRSAVGCTALVAACQTLNPATGTAMHIATTLTGAFGGVSASNLFTDTANSTGSPVSVGSRYQNQAGMSMYLDNQLFDFGSAHLAEFLVSITVTDTLTSGYVGYSGSTPANNNSRVALSAITVSQAPEPSTIFMALSALGGLAYFRRRKT